MFETRARELRATFLRNYNMRRHIDPKRKTTQAQKTPTTPTVATTATSTGALHPLRGGAPVTWRCTRTEEVHCLRIGCSARAHKNKRGTGKPSTPHHNQPEHRTQGGHRAGIEQLCCALDPHGARTYKTAPTSSHGDRGRGRGWLGRRARRAYSLTPPAVRPETMYFCRYWNSRMTGTAARTAPAAKMPHGAVRSSAAHMYMPTARVN